MAEEMNIKGKRFQKKFKAHNDDIFESFHSTFRDIPKLLESIDSFKLQSCPLGSFEIGSCNAADPENGYNFTRANCSLKLTRTVFPFGTFFITALKTLKNFLISREISSSGHIRLCLAKLLKFLVNRDIVEPLTELRSLCNDETELMVLLAFHLFSELSVSPSFMLDSRKSGFFRSCPCNKEHEELQYGDTSIGNPNVWHGYLDMIMEGAGVILETIGSAKETFKDQESSGEKRFYLEDNSAGSSVVQVAAKTIVHAFYQQKLHPDFENTLTPCIGIFHDSLVFYFYDSVHDVFLGSTNIRLIGYEDASNINFAAIIAVWLIVNHKYLCDGLSVLDINEIPKAHFIEKAHDKINIYRNNLRRGKVGSTKDDPFNLDPLRVINPKIITIPELELL